MVLFNWIYEHSKKIKQKYEVFECGFDTKYFKKSIFSTKYIIILIIFLLFDVEISFMLPLVVIKTKSIKTYTILILFLSILSTILIKEWKQGIIEWKS